MNVFHVVLVRLAASLELAAEGFDAIAHVFRARSQIRLVEAEDASFTLQRKVERERWTSIDGSVRFEDGVIRPSLPSKTRSLMRGSTLEIVLRSKHFLVRSLDLPAGAAKFLDGVVRAQIDRLTPWNASEAAFGSTSPEALDGDRIVVRVVATARSRLATFLPALRIYNVDSLRVLTDVGDGNQRSEVCVLSETLGVSRRILRLRSLLTFCLAIFLFAASSSGAAWLIVGTNLGSQGDDLRSAIAQRRADLLVKRGGGSIDAILALDARKRESLPIVLVLESLSNTLPDGTYLTDVRIESGKLQIAGLTADAPSLIRLIEQSHQFSRAAFFEPTTRTPNESGERFHLEAEIEPKWMGTH